MFKKVWSTWLPAMGDLIAYQFKRFALGAWIILVIAIAIAFWGIRQDTASITDLEKTNCTIKEFLTKAETARINSANNESNKLRTGDVRAAAAYAKLAYAIQAVGANCHVSTIPHLNNDRG